MHGTLQAQVIDISKNHFPERIETIHLIAVCGTGMGALACMLKDKGYKVTGSDQNAYPPISDFLASKGIDVTSGYDGRNLQYRPDLVIVGNAVPRENPEAIKMVEMGLHFCSMPQAINHFFAAGKKPIVITGTHGKTTTSSLVSWILYKAGLDPSFFIGGILKNFNSNYRVGQGDYIVIEGDEYDTAFFDKGPKFLHFSPHLAILTGIEFDHADIFNDLAHVKSAFNGFIAGLSPKSTIMVYDGNENGLEMTSCRDCRVLKYGHQPASDWHIESMRFEPPTTTVRYMKNDTLFGEFQPRLFGEHNLLNALSAVAIADELKIPRETIAKALKTFEGVKRRQEIRGIRNNITVMDDFAHHPTAVRETIRALKPFFPATRLIAVFEPRTNSSMRKVFQDVYPLSFDQADIICIREPSRLDKIPVNDRFSSPKLVDDLKARHKNAHYFPDSDSIIDFIAATATPGDLVLIMSNGGFDNIHQKILNRLDLKN